MNTQLNKRKKNIIHSAQLDKKNTHHTLQLEKTIKYIHRNKSFLVTNIPSERKIYQKNNTSQT